MTIFMILHIVICVFLVIVILLQPGKSDAGIGFGSSSQSIFGSKGAGNFLTKTTGICAFLFLVTSFFLTKSRMVRDRGIHIEDDKPAAASPAPVVPPTTDDKAPSKAPAAPTSSAPKKGEGVKTEPTKK